MVAGRNSVRTFGDRAYGPIWSALILGTGNALAGTFRYRWARVRPRPPRITHPRDKQEEVERPRSVHRSGTGRGLLPVGPP